MAASGDIKPPTGGGGGGRGRGRAAASSEAGGFKGDVKTNSNNRSRRGGTFAVSRAGGAV